ncbi:MAG: tail fiber domain-containing protein, partial [Limisphaerales bacterium]
GTNVLRITLVNDPIYGITANSVGGSPANVISNGVVGGFIGGGGDAANPNRVGADYASVLGGFGNTASGYSSTAMGAATIATNYASTAMGGSTTASGSYSTAMGFATTASGSYSTAMGQNTTASADYSTAMGYLAKANHKGSFVWADSQNANFASTAPNQFLIRAGGGVGIGSAVTPNGALHLRSGGLAISGASSPYNGTSPGVYIESGGTYGNIFAFDYGPFLPLPLVLNAPGGLVGIGRNPTANTLEVNGNASKTVAGSWLANSDRRIKSDIKPVDHALATLEKVRLVSFRYTDDYRASHRGVDDRRYLNVVAQEFREVFPEHVKSSGEKLANGDEILQVDTYPLTIYSAAAIQELDSKLKTKEAKINELESRLSALEKLISQEQIKKGGAQ